MTPTELREKSYKLILEARDHLAKGNAEGDAKHDEIMAEADRLEARAAKIEANEAKLAKLEEPASDRPTENRSVELTGDRSVDEQRADAWNAYLRGQELNREQRAALREMRASQNVGTPADGGYLAPDEFSKNLIVAQKAYGPMVDASVVTVISTASGNKLYMPTMDDTANKGRRINEGVQVANTNVQFGQKQLDAYKYTTDVVLVSNELLQDSALNVQEIVGYAMAERLGRILNEEFTTADGSSKPQGLIPALTTGHTTAANSAVAADEILDLIHSVDPAYRVAGSLMFNDSTFKSLRKLKDNDGRYHWQPSMQAGEAATLFGYRYHINTDMASIGAGAKPVAFGDFKKFVVRNVRGFVLRRLDERYADYDQVGFIGFARYDSELLDARAIKVLVNAA